MRFPKDSRRKKCFPGTRTLASRCDSQQQIEGHGVMSASCPSNCGSEKWCKHHLGDMFGILPGLLVVVAAAFGLTWMGNQPRQELSFSHTGSYWGLLGSILWQGHPFEKSCVEGHAGCTILHKSTFGSA